MLQRLLFIFLLTLAASLPASGKTLVDTACAMLGFSTDRVSRAYKTLQSDHLYLRENKPQTADKNYVTLYLRNAKASAVEVLSWINGSKHDHSSYVAMVKQMHLTLAKDGYTGRSEREDVERISPGKFAFEVGAPRNHAQYHSPDILKLLAKHNINQATIEALNIKWPFAKDRKELFDKVNFVTSEIDTREGITQPAVTDNAFFIPRNSVSRNIAIDFYYIPMHRHEAALQILSTMMLEILNRIATKNKTRSDKIETIRLFAKYYHAAMHLHLFKSINQSLFFNHVNVLVMLTGHKPTPQAFWDIVAMAFSADDFATIFTDHILNN